LQRERERVFRDEQERREQQRGFSRLKGIVETNQSNTALIRKSQSVVIKYKPTLTAADIRAIEVSTEDLRLYNDFLQQPKTGIVRLHDASVCLPNKNVIQADTGCPNNIEGKATGFSFRRNDYSFASLSDIFFVKNKFSAPGVFTVGIFSLLESGVEIKSFSASSKGIKQLAEFAAPDVQTDAERLHLLLKKGVEVDGSVYKSTADVKIGETYVIRSIAYRGKSLRDGSSGFKVNVLESDERADVLIVFRAVRKHEDGSITLIWKELARKPVPKTVFTEKD
jgi:hypothetical protein